MADVRTDPFVMHGARAAIAGGFLHIEEQVTGIEDAVGKNPGLAFDLARTLIESTCKTILAERAIDFDPTDDLPKLFGSVTNNLPFLPTSESGEAEVRRSLAQTLSGLHTAVLGICELRNACGFASHGSEGPRPVMESVQALLAAETADAIVGFLHRVHRMDQTLSTSRRLEYGDNPQFNAFIDEAHEPLRIFEEDFEPSRILFELGTEAYRVYLGDFTLKEEDVEEAEEEASPAEPANG